MTNEFDNQDVGPDLDEDFDAFEEKVSLGDVWRNNPFLKIVLVLAGVAVVVFAMVLFSGKEDAGERSSVASAPSITEVPGEDVDPAYEEAVREFSEQQVQTAKETGVSALPVPIGAGRSLFNESEDEEEEEDPLAIWRKKSIEQAKRSSDPVIQPEEPAVPGEPAPVRIITSSPDQVDAMTDYMSGLIDQRMPQPAQIELVTDPAIFDPKDEDQNNAGVDGEELAVILAPAGTVSYGQLMTEANTDAPGPVLAQIFSGPLKGSKIIGSFDSTQEYLILSFDQVVVDGISYAADAVALDPKTTNPGMATERDRRYFRRVILPAAAAFLEGVGEAVADEGTTTTITDGTTNISQGNLDTAQELKAGLGEGAKVAGQILQQDASLIKPLIRVASGTPIGILFVEPVLKEGQDYTVMVEESAK